MKEYWINVYKYPKLKEYCYSHDISSLDYAVRLQNKYPHYVRKVVYRIHVRMKEPQVRVTVIGNCGKPHTFQAWRLCKACSIGRRYQYQSPPAMWMEP